MLGTSISALSGSPKADKTVTRPSESAETSVADRPNSVRAAAAIAVLCHLCDFSINFLASGVQASHSARLFPGLWSLNLKT
jgi:hypothetical protein